MLEQRNLILAVVLSIAVLLGFETVWRTVVAPPPPSSEQTGPATGRPAGDTSAPPAGVDAPPAPGTEASAPPPAPGAVSAGAPGAAQVTREQAIAAAASAGGRISIETPAVQGSIRLRGARLDDLTLPEYRETLDPDSPPIHLFSPKGAPDPYYAEFGWVAAAAPDGSLVALPGPDTEWSATGGPLRPDTTVVLTWNNGQGLRFTRTISIDEHFMFTITQRVENTGTGDESGALQSAANNERVLKTLFSVDEGTLTEPFVLGTTVIVAEASDEREALEETEKRVSSMYSYLMQNYRRSDIRNVFLNSDKLEDNFMEVFSRYFMNS